MGPEGRQIDRNGTPSLPPRCASNQHFMYPVRTLCFNATSTTQHHKTTCDAGQATDSGAAWATGRAAHWAAVAIGDR